MTLFSLTCNKFITTRFGKNHFNMTKYNNNLRRNIVDAQHYAYWLIIHKSAV
jgi:hypothetical protein